MEKAETEELRADLLRYLASETKVSPGMSLRQLAAVYRWPDRVVEALDGHRLRAIYHEVRLRCGPEPGIVPARSDELGALRAGLISLLQSDISVPPGVPLSAVAETYGWTEQAQLAERADELRAIYNEVRRRCALP